MQRRGEEDRRRDRMRVPDAVDAHSGRRSEGQEGRERVYEEFKKKDEERTRSAE